MENTVNGIRDTVYRKLADDYRQEGKKSFLYRYFWQESARELVKKVLPYTSADAPLTPQELQARLCAAMREDAERAKGLLLRDPPGSGKKERRDLWQELVLNDAGYQAGLITDTGYYTWLTAYLAARDIYYKDSGPWRTDGTIWLRPLLRAGLGGTDRGGSKAQTERDIKELAQCLRQEQAAGTAGAAARLHGLTLRAGKNGKARQVEYLPWLTTRLQWAALHSKIKTWLQDSGYPLRAEGGAEAEPKAPRKQDFSMRLFDAFCKSPAGYELIPRSLSGWHMSGQGFCILDAGERKQLLDALTRRADLDALIQHTEQSDSAYLYLPLAVHMASGCVFFLAGKSIYKDVYDQDVSMAKDSRERQAAKQAKEAYEHTDALFCFDYLRPNKAFWVTEHGAARGPFRLQAAFHKNASICKNVDESYDIILGDFMRDCVVGIKNAAEESTLEESVLEKVRGLNQEAPAGTPKAFLWAFYPPEEPEPAPSRESRQAFEQARRRAPQGPGSPLT